MMRLSRQSAQAPLAPASNAPAMTPSQAETMASFARMSQLLDRKFSLPGIPFRFGLDGVVGLIPVVGDAVTGLMGLYALKIASDHRLPWHVHTRIVWNVGVDTVIGAIPLVGDLFDFAFHAHAKNRRILERHISRRAARRAQ